MTRTEGLFAKILRLINRAIVEDWDFDHIIENMERLIETYHMVK